MKKTLWLCLILLLLSCPVWATDVMFSWDSYENQGAITGFKLYQSKVKILDNGISTSSTGTWSPSTTSGRYGPGAFYSKEKGATYSFEASLSGYQKVFLWWAQHPERCPAVPVSIYDGTTLLATVTVDQTQNGSAWNLLGEYTFTGTARVVITSTSATLSTVADAVKFMTGYSVVAKIDNPASTSYTRTEEIGNYSYYLTAYNDLSGSPYSGLESPPSSIADVEVPLNRPVNFRLVPSM